jgi:hypothetical protein
MTAKQIHIEKYDFKAFEKEQKPYVMVLTELIQNFPMKHSSELLLWMFLESLPPTWKPNKQHITDYFNISDRTYERYMSFLNAANLIEYRQNRTSDGSFGEWTLVVLNGTKFSPDAVSTRTAKIDGTVIKRIKTQKVIHISDLHRSAKFGGTVPPSTEPAALRTQKIPPFRQITVERCRDGHINTRLKTNKEKKKTNNPSVSVFSDTVSVKTHINLITANRKAFVEDNVIDQGVYYAYEVNKDKSFDSVNKRINIFLKKVREGKWLIPQGFQGITSQSIREKDEMNDRKKQEQIHTDAKIGRAINQAVKSGDRKSLAEMIKEFSNANEGTVSKENIQCSN